MVYIPLPIMVKGKSFIHFSNDHIECETVVKKYKNNDGDIVTRTEHVCKEKYSL